MLIKYHKKQIEYGIKFYSKMSTFGQRWAIYDRTNAMELCENQILVWNELTLMWMKHAPGTNTSPLFTS